LNQDCFFCGETKFSLNRAVNLPCEESIIYQDDNLFITPDIAPLVKGHFLIVTHKHLLSFAEATNSIIESVNKAKMFLKHKVFKQENVFFFEHGAVNGTVNCDCVDHAHIHALPISLEINNIDSHVKNSGFSKGHKQVADHTSLFEFYESSQPYLYYELSEEGWVYSVNNIPSQFFREMIALYLKIEYNYNWKIQFRKEVSIKLFMETLEMGLTVVRNSELKQFICVG